MKSYKYIFFLLTILLFTNCKKDFFDSITEIEVPAHKPQLTITAHLNPTFNFSLVHLNYSVGILDDSPEIRRVPDATVTLLEDSQLKYKFDFKSRVNGNQEEVGRYETDKLELFPNKTYTLKVESEQYGTATATQKMLEPVPILSLDFEENGAVDRYGDRGHEVAVHFKDPSEEENYYLIFARVFYRFQDQDTTAVLGTTIGLSPVDPILEDLNGGLYFSDASFNGEEYTLRIATFFDREVGAVQRAERLEVYLTSVTRDRYLFEKTLTAYWENRENPFAEPVLVHENVEGGNGIFSLMASTKLDIQL